MNYKATALAAFISKATKHDPSFDMAVGVVASLDKDELNKRYDALLKGNLDALRHGLWAILQTDASEIEVDDAIRAVCNAVYEAKLLDNLYDDCVNVEVPVFIAHADTVGKTVKAVGQLEQGVWVTAYESGEFFVFSGVTEMDGVCLLESLSCGYSKTELYKACNLSY
ncbi:hypothetical protein [Alteromonas macleodii]|uniref:hypothetical protein n=1 Tax=Alteromonas macleodii TaxID=28108 RepID=UPI0031409DEA